MQSARIIPQEIEIELLTLLRDILVLGADGLYKYVGPQERLNFALPT